MDGLPQSGRNAQQSPDPDIEALKTRTDWFVVARTSDGQRRLCTKKQFADTFRKDILSGRFNATSTIEIHAKSFLGQWTDTTMPLSRFAKRHFKLGVLYEPVWSHAIAGLTWGALIGSGLKFVDTLIVLGSTDPRMAVMLVVVAGVCAIPRAGFLLTIGASIVISTFMKVNLFITVFAVMLTGSLLGCLPGMAIGGAIGLGRKGSLPIAGDAMPERDGLALKAVALPLLGGAGLWVSYFWVLNPWLMSMTTK